MIGYVLNGRFVPEATLAIDPLEPCFAHGLGLFETLRVQGGRALFLEPHVDRMRATADLLGLSNAPDVESARRDIALLMRARRLVDARVKIHLLGRTEGRNDVLYTAESIAPSVLPGPPIAVGCAHPRFNGASAMPGLKTLNYMANRLAEGEGRVRGLDEVVFTTKDGLLTEGTRSTIFLVRGGRLLTPSLDLQILPGVTRGVILGIAAELLIATEEGHLALSDLESADEMFLTGSVAGVRPIRRFETRRFDVVPGPVTTALAAAYAVRIGAEPLLSAAYVEG